MKIQNPHDKFFKKTFGDVAVAKDFLNNYLPQKIMGIIDIETLEPQKDSYIDEELKEGFSDLLFRANINNREGYLYLLFEHKSYPSRDVAFQLLKYTVRVWDTRIGETGQLPIIIPLVVYHGKEGWNIKPTLGEMILGYDELPQDIRALVPNYQYLLFDLSRFTDEEIKGAVITRITVMIMRDIQRKGISAIWEIVLEAVALLQELEDKETGLEYFEILMRYVFSARPDFTKDDLYELVKKIETTYPEGSEKVMTLAQAFREEGMERGIEVGLEKGETKALARTVIKFLVRRFDFVPEDLKQGISKLDAPTLDVILDRVLDFENLDEVKKYIQ
ncbi:MAG: Rpn family recombination-promoting nuclease/putative transposase [Syntrophomonadaceae bacterium]|nr:Rpn family recombination-promoting nuclease/putative transposase [Syntrophomonadaceae bacterium]